MRKTVYFHIGWGRCGSSSIQQFALQNRYHLRRRGVLYPTAGEMNLPESGAANARLLCDLRTWRPTVDIVVDYIATSPDALFLLSSEYLSARGREYMGVVRNAFAERDIDMVCVAYVREQREWLISRYAQAVKSRHWTMPLAEYIRQRYEAKNLNYHLKFEMLRGVFGESKVVPRVFERDRIRGGDVRLDLFSLMNIDVGDLIEDEPSANASASVLELETMRAINMVLPEKGFNHRKFLRQSREYFEVHGLSPGRDLHRLVEPALMREIARHYEQSNEAFRCSFFPTVRPPLFRARIPDDYDMLPASERFNEHSIGALMSYVMDLGGSARSRTGVRGGDRVDATADERDDTL